MSKFQVSVLKKIIRKNGSTQMFYQKGSKRVFLNGDTTYTEIGIMSLHVQVCLRVKEFKKNCL